MKMLPFLQHTQVQGGEKSSFTTSLILRSCHSHSGKFANKHDFTKEASKITKSFPELDSYYLILFFEERDEGFTQVSMIVILKSIIHVKNSINHINDKIIMISKHL